MRSRKKEGVYSMSILKRQVLFVLFAFAATLCAFAQNKTITGLVVDGNGESIIGASVLVKGTTNGIITDIDGKFTLNDVPEAGVIQISYIGYKTQEISAKNKTNLKVVLVEDNEMLDEVVVVGYGVQKKSDVTGAMIRVGSEELNSRPVANAFEAMQGKAAGVDIVSNERPGEVGTINVRGVRSLSASNTPLYVVDGIPLMSNSGIETLNPQDIESIDVLKDASATAIYGSRGANGVILVTTKSGKEGKMSLNYSGTVTIENLQDYSEMMNSAEYIDWRRWSYYYLNPSKYPRGDQPTKENDYEIFLGATDPTAWKNIEMGWAGGTWDGSRVPNTDWCDMVTQTGITHEHTLSASGGTDKMKGYASIGYLDNEGTVKGQAYTRYTTKLSLDLKPTKWFNLGLNVNGTFSEQQYGSSASSVGQLIKGMPSNLYAASTSLFPYASPYDENGNRIEYPGGDDKVKNVMNEWNNSQNERRMFRVNYDYNNKYLLTVSGRWDGASQLAEGNKWAFFPSAALGWRLDQEEFLKDVTWLNQLKFRLGVGVTGNSAIDPYQTKGAIVSLYYPFGATLAPGYAASEPLIKDGAVAMANKDLSWEKTTQYNIGLDYSVLNGRISGVLDFYTSRTTDLLMAMTIPSLNGYTNTYANVGKTSNIGVDITLNTVNIKTRDFEWSTSINAAWQKDKIDELANGKEDDINNNWFIGQALGVIYGYECGGLWKEEDAAEMAKFNAKGHSFQAGMVRPVDQNGDYKIDPNDDRVIIGHTRPRWTFGMTNTFTYKNFDLSVMMYGRFDYMVDTGGEWQGGRYMQRKINYYNENNKNAEYQKPIYNIGGGDPYYRIVGYKNGSFLKVRNISLGYTFPQTLIKKWNLSNLKVYVQAKNPGRIFSNIDFLELDASQAFTSTWNRGFTIGLNVGF